MSDNRDPLGTVRHQLARAIDLLSAVSHSNPPTGNNAQQKANIQNNIVHNNAKQKDITQTTSRRS